MKRFLVLLVLVAGGLAAASFSVPSNAVVVNGEGISQDQLNSDVTAIAKSADYACYLNAQEAVASQGQTGLPPVQGAGQQSANGPRTTATASYVASYLDTAIGNQIVGQLAEQRHLHVTPAQLAAARTQLRTQISNTLSEVSGSSYGCTSTSGKQVLATMPASFVEQSVQFQATATALAQSLGGIGSTTTDMQAFFNAHRSAFDNVCYSIAQYSSESAAQAAKALLYEGASFASIASQANGGPQGCDVLYHITSQLPSAANLQSLPLNTSSDPIQTANGYFLVEITSRAPSPFTTVRKYVQQAALTVGEVDYQQAVAVAAHKAHVLVNPRYGEWHATTTAAGVLPPGPPLKTDVLNTAVNSPAPAASAAGGTSPTSGQSG